ncbi:MAG: alpha/beta fold hydrolase [Phycisphaerales bacterium]
MSPTKRMESMTMMQMMRERSRVWMLGVCGGAALCAALGSSGSAVAQPLRADVVEAPSTPIERWDIVGDGAITVVCIPGLSCDGTVFDDFTRPRGDRFTFHALTLPGMAGTTPPPGVEQVNFVGTPWMDNAVRAIAHYIQSNNLDRPLVMGHAMGGTIAFRLATEHPDLISGVVSLDGKPAMPINRVMTDAERHTFIMGTYAGRLHSQTEDEWFRSTDMMANMFTLNEVRNQELAGMFRSTAHPIARRYMIEFVIRDETEEMSRSQIPTLLIGSIDAQAAAFANQAGGVEAARQRWRDTAANIPEATLVLAEDCRHFLFDECPDLVEEAMIAFIREHGLAGAEALPGGAAGGGAGGGGERGSQPIEREGESEGGAGSGAGGDGGGGGARE